MKILFTCFKKGVCITFLKRTIENRVKVAEIIHLPVEIDLAPHADIFLVENTKSSCIETLGEFTRHSCNIKLIAGLGPRAKALDNFENDEHLL